MTSMSLHPNLVSSSFDHGPGPVCGFLLARHCLDTVKFSYRRGSRGRWLHLARRPTVNCELMTCSEELQVRRCSPLLESLLLPSDNVSTSGEWNAVPDIWKTSAERYGDRIALVDLYHDPPSKFTYKQLKQQIVEFSEGLRAIGLKPDEKLSLFADNSCRWLVADQGIMATGAINVVRGTKSSTEELLQIYSHSESVALVVDSPAFFNKIAETFISRAAIKFIILLWGEKSEITSKVTEGMTVFSFKEIIDLGRESYQKLINHYKEEGRKCIYKSINSDDVATIVYTSGTSGNPKGVMLTHQNLLHQMRNFWDRVPAVPGNRFVSVLPPWHVYERAVEYFIFTRGVEQIYTTVPNMKEDLQRFQPHYIISVPLIYETLYRGIQKQIFTSSTARKLVALTFIKISLVYMEFKRIYEGKCLPRNQNQPPFLVSMFDWLLARIIAAVLWPMHATGLKLVYSKIHSAIGISKAGISGGGSLPLYVDRFFEAIGMQLQNGYGLTEASPVVAVRQPTCNVLGSVGHPLQHTEVKIVDSETDEVLPAGSKGIVKVRGPQVMKGYFKNPSATQQALDKDGWLKTGDIGWISPNHSRGRSRHCGGVIILEGRAKDTIVLTTGENVEPSELEEAALQSNLIQQIVVVGQDQRRLGAIIVPNKDELLLKAKKLSSLDADSSELSKEKVNSFLREELKTWTSECSFQIGPILIVDEPFTIDSGLMTTTMKIRRDKVVVKYSDQIAELYK
ncbi:hypothetical protein NE237_015584 [Protea cynaroides]|uniref:AMP-dependent synthetase/ligase domain-containing protein n=1 Tax=Protea cynaroides TaxID=273540 RepID=A0A9Q0KE26_9MAGN|nr:hypothetical protein NE237_015584 [Protea cynaroides]